MNWKGTVVLTPNFAYCAMASSTWLLDVLSRTGLDSGYGYKWIDSQSLLMTGSWKRSDLSLYGWFRLRSLFDAVVVCSEPCLIWGCARWIEDAGVWTHLFHRTGYSAAPSTTVRTAYLEFVFDFRVKFLACYLSDVW